MLRVDCSRWGQTPDDLRRLALEAPHARTRERFLALYEITQNRSAAGVASETARHHQTVIAWVHDYNERGPTALAFVHTGGHPPFARTSRRTSARRSAPHSRLQRRRP